MNNFELNVALNSWNPEIREIFAEDIKDYSITGKEGLYFIKHSNNRLYVYRGKEEIDRDYCELNRMTVYDLDYNGGPLIGSIKDLSFGFILPTTFNETSINEVILTRLALILKKRGLNASVNRNDILVDNKKVGGSFMKKIGNRYILCIQISFRDYMSHIHKLCTKEMKKIPSYLPSKIISRDELQSEIIKVFTKKRV